MTGIVLFLQSIHSMEKDYVSAVNVLGVGVEFAYMAGASYTRLLFMLSKTMVRHTAFTMAPMFVRIFAGSV